MRGKFRASFSAPSPMRPNEATAIDFTMPDVYHTFRKGHRILVQVQSSYFPLVDLNPQRFEDIYSAEAADFQSATQRVYRGAKHTSRIEIDVLPTKRGRSRAR
jgi:predicted acyl esterase